MGAHHTQDLATLLSGLGTDAKRGLTSAAAGERLHRFGPNELPQPPRVPLWRLFLRQFRSELTYVLFAAAAASVYVGEPNDAIGIIVAVLIDAVFGFEQERRAEGAVDKLKEMLVRETVVIRDGGLHRRPVVDLVPGDVLALQEGDRVPADARLLDVHNLTTDESSLTGESIAVAKTVGELPEATALPDRTNMIWMGTTVVGGAAKAVVVETGPTTAFGEIASSLTAIARPRAPFEERIGRLSRQLGVMSVLAAIVIFIAGYAQGFPLTEMFIFTIAVAVSVIPEGLPAVLAVVLAVGVQRMAKRHVIVRHVPAVETLGAADVICTDKTGTLTENKMTVRQVMTVGADVKVTGEGWSTEGSFEVDGRRVAPSGMPELIELFVAAAACSRASMVEKGGHVEAIGDRTEVALSVLAAKGGVTHAVLEDRFSEIDEMPFSSERRYRAVLGDSLSVDSQAKRWLYVMGAPGVLRRRCRTVLDGGLEKEFDADISRRIEMANLEAASRAMRVIAVARKPMPSEQAAIGDADVEGLTMLGLVGMVDPPRAGVGQALERCRRAGVRVIMVTGDQKATAVAVAKEIGLLPDQGADDRVFVETEVAEMDDEAFRRALDRAVIFARVTPATKLRIVEHLQRQGHLVAMTGDGVNDAPALKQAAIGVAMGSSGTDVSREVADMVLTDDNFENIVNAIEEGRVVFRNVKQTNAYLFTTNIAEAVTIMTAIFIGLPLPLLPTQILWMNLVTDGLPDIALATEPAGDDVLDEPPRRRGAHFVTRSVLFLTGLASLLMCGGTLAVFGWTWSRTGDLAEARTVAFTVMAIFQLWNVFNMRSATISVFRLGFLSNRYVLGAVVVSFLLQVAVIYLPILSRPFGTVPLSALDWLIALAVSSSALIAVELYKVAIRRGLVPQSWL